MTHHVYVHPCVYVFVSLCICMRVCMHAACLYVFKCYVVGYREQHNTIDGIIPSNLWGTDNNINLPCGLSRKIPFLAKSKEFWKSQGIFQGILKLQGILRKSEKNKEILGKFREF